MNTIKLLARNGEAVRNALELGEIVHLDTASEEITDEFLLFAIHSGLLRTWAEAFPDPRSCCEITLEVILASSLAARFSAIYSLRKTGYVLRSARVLGALGYSVEVLSPGNGLSSRGTEDDKLISGDVIRKMIVKMEQQVEINPPKAEQACQKTPPIKIRKRASRRLARKDLDIAEEAARAKEVGRLLTAWYNKSVGESMLEYGEMGQGRPIHILDTTKSLSLN